MTTGAAARAEWSPPLNVLVVCQGNVCRSPVAELLLREAVPTGLVRVVSVGLTALAGQPVAAKTAGLLQQRGIDASEFRSRPLRLSHVARADLVVVMTRAQRYAVVSRVPSALRRTWTLLDLAGTLEHSGLPLSAGPAALLAARTGSLGDVPDPWGQSAAAHRHAFDLVDGAVRAVAGAAG